MSTYISKRKFLSFCFMLKIFLSILPHSLPICIKQNMYHYLSQSCTAREPLETVPVSVTGQMGTGVPAT